MSSNPFSVLENELDGGDASNAGRGAKKAAASAASGKKPLPASSFPGEQPAKNHSARVPDRQKDNHRGGRGGAAARGGRGGANVDTSVRQFDRRGAPQKHAPNHAHRDGAALGPEGGAEAVHAGDSAADVAVIEETEDVPDMVIEAVDPDDDGKQTYDQYLASRRLVEDTVQIREVINDESQFNKVKPLVREDEEESKDETEEERTTRRNKKQNKKQVLNLDEFRGGREGDAKYKPVFESTRGGRGGVVPRGRGGFVPRGRGGRGGAFTPRDGAAPAPAAGGDAAAPEAARGGRGGARGGRGGAFVPRGGRGGAFVPRGGRGGSRGGFAPALPINDKAAFPALGQ